MATMTVRATQLKTLDGQTENDLLYCSSATALAKISGLANAVLVTSAGKVPSLSLTLPTAVQDNITRLGTVTTGGFPAANLTGTTLASNVVTSSLTAVGTITTGVWNAGAITSSGKATINSYGIASPVNASIASQVYVPGNNAAGDGILLDRTVANEYGLINFKGGSLNLDARGGTSSYGEVHLRVYNGTSTIDALGIGSTGAATFASSISATKLLLTSGEAITWGGAYGAGTPAIYGASSTLYFNPGGSTSGTQLTVSGTSTTIGGTLTVSGLIKHSSLQNNANTYNWLTFRNTGSGYESWGFAKTGSNDLSLMRDSGSGTDTPSTEAVKFAAAGVTIGGTLTVNGAGAHTMNASLAGDQSLGVRNTSNSASASTSFYLGNDTTATRTYIQTTSVAAGATADLYHGGAGALTITAASGSSGGLNLKALDSSGAIRFYTGGATQRWMIGTDGNLQPNGANGILSLPATTYSGAIPSGTGSTLVTTAGTTMAYVTSSRRFKENIFSFSITPSVMSAYLALTPQWWDYKGQQNGAAGFIAEDLAELPIRNAYGTSPLVNYDSEGRVESNRDFAIIAMQHLVLQSHDTRIAQLEAEVQRLKQQAA